MFIKFFLLALLLLVSNLYASEVTIIELHQNKSLDQLVLEQENKDKDDSSTDISSKNENNITENLQSNNDNISDQNQDEQVLKQNSEDEVSVVSSDSEEVNLVATETIFETDDRILLNYLETIKDIKSNILRKEFFDILFNINLENNENYNDKIFNIIKKLYAIGEIQKAYNLIQQINLDLIENKEVLIYYHTIKLNYLLSTFQLSEVCDFKTILVNKSMICL